MSADLFFSAKIPPKYLKKYSLLKYQYSYATHYPLNIMLVHEIKISKLLYYNFL